jgi:hypothetical protein
LIFLPSSNIVGFVLQGMSDFLAPILYVMGDESESFWCFASLMERLGANFNRDQNGMHAQLLALSKVYNIFIMKVLEWHRIAIRSDYRLNRKRLSAHIIPQMHSLAHSVV